MKRLFHLFLALNLAAGAGACSDDAPKLNINGGTEFLSLDALSRSGAISVDAPGPWSILLPEQENWFTLSPLEGPAGRSEVDATFEANPGAARSARITFVCDGKNFPFRLSQSAGDAGFDAPEYYFYAAFGTLPALYSGLHLLSHDKPSWFFYERPKTFDPDLFPAYATPYTAADRNGAISDAEVRKIADELKRRILAINAADPTALFGLYVTDLTCRVGYDWFVAQGIDSARVKVTMLSDGTATYNNFWNYFGDPATAERNWDAYAAQVEALDWNHGGRYPVTRAPADFNSYTWPYYLSTRPDYRLVVQNRELFESSGPFIDRRLAGMKIESVQPYDLLNALPAASRQHFYRMTEFDYDRFEALLDASPKKNLVILGTSNFTPEGVRQQAAYVARVVARYGGEYDLFFKPHPADYSSADYPERFEGLTLLPGQMPFEIFAWALLDRIDMIGGYPSTSFISLPLSKVGFLFAPDAASLVRPLNILFRDAPDVEWMQ